MFYPVIFKPVYKEMLWGGSRMHQMFGRELPFKKTGESWDITCRPNEMGIVENGPDKGLTFLALTERDPVAYLGRKAAIRDNQNNRNTFPLLIKIIDANDNLSIQVHPDDEYAFKHGKDGADTGKSEMWYIMEAPAEGCLIIGLKDGVTRETLSKALEVGKVEDCLHYLPVAKGDMVDIPAGLVHALTKGVMVAEVQQNSDITYRLYDYNRLDATGNPRPLHIADSLNTADFEGRIPKQTVTGTEIKKGENQLVTAVTNRYFTVSKYVLREPLSETSDPDAFTVFTCVDGFCRIATPDMTVDLPASRSAFIPAQLGQYTLEGECVLLKSSV